MKQSIIVDSAAIVDLKDVPARQVNHIIFRASENLTNAYKIKIYRKKGEIAPIIEKPLIVTRDTLKWTIDANELEAGQYLYYYELIEIGADEQRIVKGEINVIV